MELGSRLRELREARGISQEVLAQELYVSRQTISNWETGKTYPDIENILLLAEFYGASLDDLVKGDVDEMAKTIEAEAARLGRLANAMAVLMAAALVGALVWLRFGQRAAAIAWALALWLCAMACAIMAERIKRDNDLVTYAEISAFMDGEDPERDPAARTLPRRAAATAAKLGAGGLLGIPLFVGAALWGNDHRRRSE